MTDSKSKILILVPKTSLIGGIANYYQSLRPFLAENYIYFTRGGRGADNHLYRLYLLIYDIIRLAIKVVFFRPKVCIINTSIGYNSLRRDALFIRIIKTTSNSKIVVFFRGWDNSFFEKENVPKWFIRSFLTADSIIVLAKSSKEIISNLGYKAPIFVETTTVNESVLKIREFPYEISTVINLLFMSRIEADKGVNELIDAVKILQQQKLNNIKLDIAGTGSITNNIIKKIKDSNLKNIFMHGFVKDISKSYLLNDANIFIFPSSHGEGMPNSILEAMSFGIPIITTKIGGVPDFFEDGKMGLFLDNCEPKHIAEKIQYLLEHPVLMKQMSEYNYNYAKERFYASKVASRLENIITSVGNEATIR
ncbi:MAG: glycosyltransferase family 4 protein [Acholeplasma sp.]|nr:glycosyltransferase family 4 protein [Acholeplasma sp.]